MAIGVSSRSLVFPNLCACCGEPPSTSVKVEDSDSTQTGNKIKTTTISWDLPYCAACVEHVDKQRGIWSLLLRGAFGEWVVKQWKGKPNCTQMPAVPFYYSNKSSHYLFNFKQPDFIRELKAKNPSVIDADYPRSFAFYMQMIALGLIGVSLLLFVYVFVLTGGSSYTPLPTLPSTPQTIAETKPAEAEAKPLTLQDINLAKAEKVFLAEGFETLKEHSENIGALQLVVSFRKGGSFVTLQVMSFNEREQMFSLDKDRALVVYRTTPAAKEIFEALKTAKADEKTIKAIAKKAGFKVESFSRDKTYEDNGLIAVNFYVSKKTDGFSCEINEFTESAQSHARIIYDTTRLLTLHSRELSTQELEDLRQKLFTP